MIQKVKADPGYTYKQIYHIISRIPAGQVASYGQIARIAGKCTPRQVGYALHALPHDTDIPWYRVINRLGEISPRKNNDGHEIQKILLQSEGVPLDDNGRIDMDLYRWIPKAESPEPGL